MNLTKICERHNVKYAKVYYAMVSKKMPLMKAIKYAKRKHLRRRKVKGLSLRQYCKEKGLSYKAVLQRMYRGRTVKKAVGRRYKYYYKRKLVRSQLSPAEYSRFIYLVRKGMNVSPAFRKVKRKINEKKESA